VQVEALPRQGYNSLLVPLLEAWIDVGKGRFDSAIKALDVFEGNEGFAVFRQFHAALINDIAGDVEAAEKAYRLAVDAQAGGSFRAVTAFGSFYERTGQPESAIELYRNYQQHNPDSIWLEPVLARQASGRLPERMVRSASDGAAEALFGLASVLYQENAFEATLLYTRLANRLRSQFDAGMLLLGEVLESQSRPGEAVEAYKSVPPTSPLLWSARLRVAANLDNLNRTGEAVAELRKMSKERPERSDALIALGDLLRAKENWTEAVDAYDQAIGRIQRLERRHWRSLYARGIALERSKQWSRAESDFLKALDLEPDQPFVLNYLGYSWVDHGENLDRAFKMIERAVDLRPNDGYIVDSLGWAQYRMENFSDAVTQLERAVELRPDDPTINDHLGDAYWRVDRRAEARFQWRRALSLSPETDDQIATIERKLKKGLLPTDVANGGS
jgi:tetratricopeptide (TPR) repeat protein